MCSRGKRILLLPAAHEFSPTNASESTVSGGEFILVVTPLPGAESSASKSPRTLDGIGEDSSGSASISSLRSLRTSWDEIGKRK